MLEKLTEDVWNATVDNRVGPGFHLPVRMVVVRRQDGSLWVHSPIPLDAELCSAIDALGSVQSLVAPNVFHTSFLAAARERYPAAQVFAAPGAAPKLSGVEPITELTDGAEHWAPELDVVHVGGLPKVDEYAFYHRPSRSLIVTDLLFNMGETKGWLTPLILLMVGTRSGCACSRLTRSLRTDPVAVAASLDRLLALPFDRVIVAHGDALEGADLNQRLAAAFARLR
jgi:hypothetical protein